MLFHRIRTISVFSINMYYVLLYLQLKINVLCLCIAPWSDSCFLHSRAKLIGVPAHLHGITYGPIHLPALYVLRPLCLPSFTSSVLPASSDTDITPCLRHHLTLAP
jgi:hypothetical protein